MAGDSVRQVSAKAAEMDLEKVGDGAMNAVNALEETAAQVEIPELIPPIKKGEIKYARNMIR